MTDMTYVNETSFAEEVLQAGQPVLVDFGAVWCGPCKMLDPIVHQLSQEWAGKVKVVKLDVDENADLAARYGVMGVPTLMLFVDGAVKDRVSGYQPKEKLVARLGPQL
jgi:thioredoxin 1